MKRLSLMLCAAAIGVVATSQAQASWSVIRWTSGFCQVWDNGLPTKPFPADYRVLHTYKKMDTAVAKRTNMCGKCGW